MEGGAAVPQLLAGAGGGGAPLGVRGKTPLLTVAMALPCRVTVPRGFSRGLWNLVKNVFNGSFVE